MNNKDNFFANVSNHAAWLRSSHLSRQLAYYEIFKQSLKIPGSIAEFGVWRGSNFFFLARLLEIFSNSVYEPNAMSNKYLYGFDTFEGLKGVTKNDKSGNFHAQNKEGGLSFDVSIFEEALKYMKSELIYPDRIKIFKGDVTSTWPKFIEDNPGAKFSLVILDLDIYEPTNCILEKIYPFLSKGSFLIFDDYGYEEWPGATKAIDKFTKKHSLVLERKEWSYGPGAYCRI